jgi:signal transduction histidine kinase
MVSSGTIAFVGYVTAFATAGLASFAGLARTGRVSDPDTRRGLVALLLTSGGWAGSHVGYLLARSVPLQSGFYTLGLVFGFAAVGAWLYFCSAYTGRSYHRQRPYRALAVAVFVLVVGLKLTNPVHGLYLTATSVTTPFPYLAVRHGILHWLAMGLSYALATVGIFVLVERFSAVGYDSTPLVVLVGFTGLPLVLDLAGLLSPRLLDMTYEPLGVAVFAVGLLFVYVERFQAIQLAGGADDPAIYVDAAGRVRETNRAALALFPELEGALGEPLERAVPELASGGERIVDRRRDGEHSYYRVSETPLVADEADTGRILTLTDVTEEVEHERALEEQRDALELLNQVLRHDIRNDIQLIQTHTELLETHVDEAGHTHVETVRDSAENAVDLTRTARELAEVMQQNDTDTEAIALDHTLIELRDQIASTYPEAEIRIEGDLPSVAVVGTDMLDSAFRNLLTNAIQHNDTPRPEVTISVAERDGRAVVRIADNGPGIPDGQKELIFGEGERGLDSQGTGLGLYLVQSLVYGYGGDVRVEDNDPAGSVFVVELPTVSARPDHPGA